MLHFDFSRFDLIVCKVQFISFVKRKPAPLSNSKSVKVTKNMIDF